MQHMHAVTRDEEPEAGFTLIELMVVVLIIAILIAVMIPTFVGAKATGARPSHAVELAQRFDCGEGRLQRSRGLHRGHGGRARRRRARALVRRRRLGVERPERRLGRSGQHELHRHGRTVEVGRVLLRVG